MAELCQEVEDVCDRNTKMFEFAEETKIALQFHFSNAPRDNAVKVLYFDWMLQHVNYF